MQYRLARWIAKGIRALLVSAAIFLWLPLCSGQGASSVILGGNVFDAQQRVLAKAKVVVTSDERGTTWTTYTNHAGAWRVEGLIAGHYHFAVSADGFKRLEHSSVELQIGDQKFFDVALEVGSVSEAIVVEATTPLIDTTASVSGTVINNAQLSELPSQTNSPVEMARLIPGVILGPPTGGTPHLWNNSSESNFVVDGSGQGANATNYQLDGATNTEDQSGIAYIPPMDAIAEVRVSTNAYDASIGRTAAGTIELSMKSGTEKYHGTMYEMNQNNFLNANSYTNSSTTPVPVVRMNEYGATVGGPIWIYKLYNGKKENTFFFFNWDGIRNSSPFSSGTMSLPTAAERQGDFSHSFTTNTVNGVTTVYPIMIYDPLTYNAATGSRSLMAGTGTSIPSGRISTMAKAYLALMPLPNRANDGTGTDANNYVKNDPKVDKFANWALRVDHAWNNNNHSFAEYRWNKWSEAADDPFGPTNILSVQLMGRENWGFTADHTWVLSPKLVLDVRANLTAFNGNTTTLAAGVDPTQFGFNSNFAALQQFKGLPTITGVAAGWDGSGMGAWNEPSYKDDRLWETHATLTQIHGNHTFRYGVHYLLQQQANGTLSAGNGKFGFGSNWTVQNPDATAGYGDGSVLGSFLLGLPTSGSLNIDATSFFSNPYCALYAQDDWRVTSKLTFNVGMRWDYQGALTERFDRYWSRFDPSANIAPVSNYIQPRYAALIGTPGTNLGAQALAASRTDASAFNAYGAIEYANLNGISRSVSDPLKRYFQPRVGFAYQLRKDLVLRGGYGRFVESSFVSSHAHQDGFSSTTSYLPTLDNYHTVHATLDNPFPSGLVPVTGNSNGVLTNVGNTSSYFSNQGRRNDIHELSLHLQQQVKTWLFQVGGVLNMSRSLVVANNVNPPVSIAAWRTMYSPVFAANGRPVDTLPGDTQVANPFLGAPYITNGLQSQKTVSAYQLSRINPLVNGGITYNNYSGHSSYYALQTKAEHRFRGGFGILANYTWGKQMDVNAYYTSYIVSQKFKRTLSGSDSRFQVVISPTYELPIGSGKWIAPHVNHYVNGVIGGWELSGIYTFTSGTPVSMPTNSAYWDGADPSLGSQKTRAKWFDTSHFYPFPGKSTSVATIASYPSWTGIQSLPGYSWTPTTTSDAARNGVYNDYKLWNTNNTPYFGDVRNPYTNNFDLGMRKSFSLYGDARLQLRFDAFNALNHPLITGPSTSPSSAYFGRLSGTLQYASSNQPRAIQIAGKIIF